MKVLITTLNSKYIHTALALRLLYVATKDQFDVNFKEYTIKDDLNMIKEDLLQMNLDVLAFSTYIWNVEYIKKLTALLKQQQPNLKIILGGPEVSYEPAYFLNHFDIEFIISGEGEITFKKLLQAISNDGNYNIAGVSYIQDQKVIINDTIKNCDLSEIEKLPSPYLLERDLKHIQDRIVYFESSRGCPYQCQYCLSSLEKGVRFFSIDYIQKQLKAIIDAGAKTIKFLDRSFNVNPNLALQILKFIVENHRPNQQFQFEINADVLDQRIIDYVNEYAPSHLIRFEIGIQSTYEPTNVAIKRHQDFQRLSEVILSLVKADKVELHLDLIAGLPYESYDRFKQSFDDVFAFRAKELQLGFLKMLRGTNLRKNAKDYDYNYQEEAPYEMIDNHVLTMKERNHIHIAEDMLEKYWNSGRCYRTLNYLFDHHFSSPFDFFHDFGIYYQQHNFKTMGYQTDELFKYLYEYLKSQNIDALAYLIEDYLMLFKIKPKKWWQVTMDTKMRKQFIRQLLNSPAIQQINLNQEQLYRYTIVEKINNLYIVCCYQDYQARLYKIIETKGVYQLSLD